MTAQYKAGLSATDRLKLLFESPDALASLGLGALGVFISMSLLRWGAEAYAGNLGIFFAALAMLMISALFLATLAAAALTASIRDIASEPGAFGQLSADVVSAQNIKAYRIDASGPFCAFASRIFCSCFIPSSDCTGGTAIVATTKFNPERSKELDRLAELGWSPSLVVQYIAQHEFAHALLNLKHGRYAYLLNPNADESIADAYALLRLFDSEDIQKPASDLARARLLVKGTPHDTSAALFALACARESWSRDEPMHLALDRAERIARAALGIEPQSEPLLAEPAKT